MYLVSLERSIKELYFGIMQIVMTSLMTSLEVKRSSILWVSQNPVVPARKRVNIPYAVTKHKLKLLNI